MKDSSDSRNSSASGHGNVAAAGAKPSNTAPANSNSNSPSSSVRVLRQGLDSLYLSFPGNTGEDAHRLLQRLQEAARSPYPDEQAKAVLELGEHRFEVTGKGTRTYKFVLVDAAYHIQVSSISAERLPLAYVQVRSDWLTRLGPVAVVEELRGILGHLGEIAGEPLVSRADVFADFACAESLGALEHRAFVSRARGVTPYSQQRATSGYSVGLGGQLSARLYDKLRELEKSQKFYLVELWVKGGWRSESDGPVWRLEFQWNRDALSRHGIDHLTQLLAALGRLWRYATLEWLRLTIPNPKDRTQSRWPLHPVWEALSYVCWPESLDGVSIPARAERIPSRRFLFVNGLAPVSSFMACLNLTDPEEAFREFFKEAKGYHDARQFTEGVDFRGYMLEKAALKARQYNLPYGEGARREGIDLEDAARAYEKATRGD